MAKMLTDDALLGGLFADQVAETIQAEVALKSAQEEAEREASRDSVAERLLADGFFPNEYLLESDGSFCAREKQSEYGFPWNLPSRLFQFPMKTMRGPDGVRRIAMLHPLLAEHPLVKEFVAKGYQLSSADDCVNSCGTPVSFMDHGEWWHAVDLISHNHRALLQTRQFTTDLDIMAAVVYRCQYPRGKGGLDSLLKEMREVMAALGSVEPEDQEANFRVLFAAPRSDSLIQLHTAFKSERSEASAWAFIHGIENGWFTSKRDFLMWSKKGTEKFAR